MRNAAIACVVAAILGIICLLAVTDATIHARLTALERVAPGEAPAGARP